MTLVEDALQGVRAEWIEESTVGEFPTTPIEWNLFSDYIDDGPGWSPPGLTENNNAVGSGDVVEITRGTEETHELTIEYWAQRPFVDKSAVVQDPAGYPFQHDYQTEYTSHTINWRREVTEGGVDGAGYRVYTVASGARPVSVTIPGDPGENSPQSLEVDYEAEYARSHRIDQPSSSTTLDVSSNSNTVDVKIENEDGSTVETVTDGNTSGKSFGDIDAVEIVTGEPQEDIEVSISGGSTLVTIPGTNTNVVEADRGVPTTHNDGNTGSHAPNIGNDPDKYLGLNTASTYGSDLITPDRVHQFDITCELDTDNNARQSTRAPSIDIGPRTVTAEADFASEDASTQQIKSYLQGFTGEVSYALGGNNVGGGVMDIDIKQAQITDVDEQSFGAGDANNIFGVTFTGQENSSGTVVNLVNTT